jgi:hypothetical protein
MAGAGKVALVAAIVVVALPALAQAQQPRRPAVTVVGPTTVELIADEQAQRLTWPLALRRGSDVKRLRAVIVAVRAGRTRNGAVSRAFEARATGSNPNLRLTLDVNLAPALRPATYNLLIELLRRGSGQRVARVRLGVVVPAAALSEPATAIVIRRTPWYLFGAPDVEPATVVVRETSRVSRLTQLGATTKQPPSTDDGPVSGMVSASLPENMDPGAREEFEVTASGDFPHERATGQLELDALELPAPVALSVEVRTRRERGALASVALLGLLAGWLTRTWLKRRQERGAAQLSALRLLGAVQDDLVQARDDDLIAELRAIETRLQAVLDRSPDAEEITAAVTAGNTSRTKAYEGLATRYATAKASVDAIAPVTATPWTLSLVATALQEVSAHVAAGKSALAQNDAATAEQAATAATATFASGVAEPLGDWRAAAADLCATLRGRPPLTAEQRTLLSPRIADACGAVDAMPEDRADRVALLSKAQSAGKKLRAVTAALPSATEVTVEAVRLRWGEQADAAAELDRLDIAAATARTALASLGGGDPAAIRGAAEELRALESAIAALVRAGAAEQHDLEKLIHEGHYGDVAARPDADAGDVPLGPQAALQRLVGSGRLGGFLGLAPEAAPAPGALAGLAVVSEGPAPAMPLPVGVRIARTRRQVAWTEALQTLLLGTVFVLLAYWLLADDFTGTSGELLGIFAWAYATDLTVDRLREALAPYATTLPAPQAPAEPPAPGTQP